MVSFFYVYAYQEIIKMFASILNVNMNKSNQVFFYKFWNIIGVIFEIFLVIVSIK